MDHLSGVSKVSLDRIGADGDLLIAPLVGGTAKLIVVVALTVHAEILEVLLAELNGVVRFGVGVTFIGNLAVVDMSGIVLVAGHILASRIDNHGAAVAGGDVHAAGVLHHGGLEGIQGQQAGSFTVDGLAALEVQAVEQVRLAAESRNANGPARAGEALNVAVITKRAEEHLGESKTSEGAAGTEGAIIVAVDDLFRLAEADVARKHVASGDIGVGAVGGGESLGGLGADQQRHDDLCSRAAGQLALGTEVAFGIAGDNTEPVQNGDRFLVLDFILIGEIFVLGGAGADRNQGKGHDQCQSQGQEFLHGTFLLLKLRVCARPLVPVRRSGFDG